MRDILEAFATAPPGDILRLVIVALPTFVLLLLVALFLRARAKRRADRRKAGRLGECHGLVSGGRREWPSDTGGDQSKTAELLDVRAERCGRAEEGLHAAIQSLQATLNGAMNIQTNTALAPIYLELALKYLAAGDEAHYNEALLAAAALAAQHGPRSVHAEVRLELAAAAVRAGDTTGACEQWQMARIAFEEDGQKDAYDRVDLLMRENGCPTDWVLTDF
jgi:hypothetical protein